MTHREEIIGDCRLILGDCREVLPTLGPVDAVVTDPPYGIGDAPITASGAPGKRSGKAKSNSWHPDSHWDKEIDPAWGALCADAAPVIAWFGHWRKRVEVEAAIAHPLRAEIVWAKDTHVGHACPVAMRDERIWLFAKGGIRAARFETSVWDHPIIPTWSFKHHKNEKPVSLMARLLSFLGCASALDPFMGSGTTGVACVNLGLSFVGIEREAEHFETACRRIEEAYRQPRLFAEPEPKPVQEAFDLLPSVVGEWVTP